VKLVTSLCKQQNGGVPSFSDVGRYVVVTGVTVVNDQREKGKKNVFGITTNHDNELSIDHSRLLIKCIKEREDKEGSKRNI